jgi:hypothetical protein
VRPRPRGLHTATQSSNCCNCPNSKRSLVQQLTKGHNGTGWVKLPLPYPAVKQYAQDVPSSVYPWRPSAIDQVCVSAGGAGTVSSRSSRSAHSLDSPHSLCVCCVAGSVQDQAQAAAHQAVPGADTRLRCVESHCQAGTVGGHLPTCAAAVEQSFRTTSRPAQQRRPAPAPQSLSLPALCHSTESVNVSPDGRLVMIDKYGAVRAAPKQPISNSTQLDPLPIAHLGPGRALGFTFDAEGNLVVCDALKVRSSRLTASGTWGASNTHSATPLPARAFAQAAAACAADKNRESSASHLRLCCRVLSCST